MCVMCAYVGKKKQAAPLLLESGKRIEGLWSGYYTGIGVLGNDGVIRNHKTTGCSKCWESRFSVEELPGTVGFFHSRTNSGGDSRYAHPFLSADGSVLLISQGSGGHFKADQQKLVEIGNRLLDQNTRFSSADYNAATQKYPNLKDGSQVHASDLVTEYAADACKRLGDPFAAVHETASVLREESVSLFLFRDWPEHIYVANMNQRLCLHFQDDGAFLSTCALALGDTRRRLLEIPPNSVSEVTAGTIKVEPLAQDIVVDTRIPAGLLESFIRYLSQHPSSLLAHITDNAIAPHYTGERIEMRAAAAYDIFERLYYDGMLKLENTHLPGAGKDQSISALISLNNSHPFHYTESQS